MIRKMTVFVLGAGASKPYNFPLGAELRHQIVTQTLEQETEGWTQLRQASFADTEIAELRSALSRSWATSIDAFLSSRSDLGPVGKAAVFATLAPCEQEQLLFQAKPEEDWFRHLWRY